MLVEEFPNLPTTSSMETLGGEKGENKEGWRNATEDDYRHSCFYKDPNPLLSVPVNGSYLLE